MLDSWPFARISMKPDPLDRLGAALLVTGYRRAGDIRTLLHLHAEHLRAGGRLDTSPLRPLSRDEMREYAGIDDLTAMLRRAARTS